MKDKIAALLREYRLAYGAIFDFDRGETRLYGDPAAVPVHLFLPKWLDSLAVARGVYDGYRGGKTILPTVFANGETHMIIHLPAEGRMAAFLTNQWTFEDTMKQRAPFGQALEALFK